MSRPQRPTHNIVLGTRALQQNGKRSYTKAGVAWQDGKGRISLRLHPGVVLDHRLHEDYYISLFPRYTTERDVPPPEPKDLLPDDFGDDEIPF